MSGGWLGANSAPVGFSFGFLGMHSVSAPVETAAAETSSVETAGDGSWSGGFLSGFMHIFLGSEIQYEGEYGSTADGSWLAHTYDPFDSGTSMEEAGYGFTESGELAGGAMGFDGCGLSVED